MTDKQHIDALVKKASEAPDSQDAMRFSQAACNVANALCAISDLNRPPLSQEALDALAEAGVVFKRDDAVAVLKCAPYQHPPALQQDTAKQKQNLEGVAVQESDTHELKGGAWIPQTHPVPSSSETGLRDPRDGDVLVTDYGCIEYRDGHWDLSALKPEHRTVANREWLQERWNEGLWLARIPEQPQMPDSDVDAAREAS